MADTTTPTTIPPLPTESVPDINEGVVDDQQVVRSANVPDDNGWQCFKVSTKYETGFHYFYNAKEKKATWANPYAPEAPYGYAPPKVGPNTPAPGTSTLGDPAQGNAFHPEFTEASPVKISYNPTIHGSWNSHADYVDDYYPSRPEPKALPAYTAAALSEAYEASSHFNRRTGKFQDTNKKRAELHSEGNRALRQQHAFFDVERAANNHGGKSLKEERRQQKPTAKQLQEWKQKRQEKKRQKDRDFYIHDK
ncbi:hypothetical protein LTR50_001323 [Elasticomyces elasticus]|nr:hypothetical protein LTR50_001323 [Elasticomyces elasticus]